MLEYLGSTVGVVPVRCRLCRRRNIQVLWAQAGAVIIVLAVMLGCVGFGYKQFKAKNTANRPTPAAESGRGRGVTQAHSVVLNLENLMRNSDVIRLKKAGIGQRVLIRLIETSASRFRLDPNEVVALKEAGVDDEVIDAMIGAVQRSPAAATTQASVGAPIFNN